MLTGSPPHVGASVQQIIMKIVTEDAAPVTKLRKAVPANVAAAVAKAVERMPADRFESARALADALGNPAFRHGEPSAAGVLSQGMRSRWRDPVTLALAAVALVAVIVAGVAFLRPAPPGPVGTYAVALDSAAQLAYRGFSEPARLALTPDGSTLVYVGNRRGAPVASNQLFVRPLASLEARPLPGTVGATRPAVSWDGSQVAFLAGLNGDSLRVAPLGGGPTLTLADSAIGSGPTWGPGGFVYYLTRTGIIRRVSGSGGPTEDVVQLPAAPDSGTYHWLMILPGGHGGVVGVHIGGQGTDARYTLYTVDLATGKLGATFPGMAAHFVAEAKALVYVTADGSLMAVPFDPSTRKPRGRPQALLTGVSFRRGETDLDIAGGMLAYALQGQNGTEYMGWVDRVTGVPRAVDSTWDDTEFESFALSPDGSRLAITIGGGGTSLSGASNQARYDIWLKQMDHGPISRLSFGGEDNEDPSWTADGRYVSYCSLRGGHVTCGAAGPMGSAARNWSPMRAGISWSPAGPGMAPGCW